MIERIVASSWTWLLLTDSRISIRNWILESPLVLTQKRNIGNRTQACSVEIWIEEKLSLFKARGVITGNILLLKYEKKKQTITAALNGKGVLMSLPRVSRKSWICQVLLYIYSRGTLPIGKKTPDRGILLECCLWVSFLIGNLEL